MSAPACMCGAPSRLTDGREVYPHRPDLYAKSIFVCTAPGCDGRVGCHPGTSVALGTPAAGPLRGERMKTHAVIDPLWKTAHQSGVYTKGNPRSGDRRGAINRTARSRVYEYLAAKMGLTRDEAHVGLFNQDQCRRAQEIFQGLTYADIRAWAKARTAEVAA